MGVEFRAKSVILTAGTFLGGLMHIGRNNAEGGRAGDSASHGITEQLVELGFEAGRMKTGTPVRIDVRSLPLERFERQDGDAEPSKFSFLSSIAPVEKQKPCYLVYTSVDVHDTLREGFDDSPLFQGLIKGIGPRYCPSIEDKLRTFADKEFHQLFLEPEGENTNEYYLNGFSSSLPWQVQCRALEKIEGFENVEIYRPGFGEAVSITMGYVRMVGSTVARIIMPQHTMEVVSQSSSIVGISTAAADAAKAGPNDLVLLIAAVSISLGFMNLLPIPPLDGGKIVVETIQAILHRPLSTKAQVAISYVGVAFFVFVFVVVLRNDIMRFFVG
jgi:membrane-associated protease RseP (regulator of RpoE activity)